MDNTEKEFGRASLKTALQIYSLYRLLQISALLTLFFLGSATGYLGSQQPQFFIISAIIYFFFCLVTVVQTSIPRLPKPKDNGILFIFLIDVLAIASFMHFSGGVHGSLGIMMVVIVATAGIFLQGRLALFIAALASLAILAVQIYLYLIFDKRGDSFAAIGILGLALFGAALIVQQLAERLRASERLLSEQKEQVQALEKINEQIIERMPNGVIVIDKDLRIRFMNTAAWRLLMNPKIPDAASLYDVSPSLGRQVKTWLLNPNIKPETFSAGNAGSSLSANFAHMGESRDAQTGTIIFIEDATEMSERAQKMKLASLGTLTAGIAHEIRNPLGAISHAAQLLHESQELSEADRRLTEIIQQHSIRMNRIIENVLQLSRQKAANPGALSLKSWLKDFVKDFRSSKPYEIELHLSTGSDVGEVQIDSSQLTQVLTNLCENGLRYSHAHSGSYYLSIQCEFDKEQHYHYIDIIDKGPGITEEVMEHVFEPFFTTDSKGSGLGLYIAKELCETNRSKLVYIPRKTGGCFRIIFPG